MAGTILITGIEGFTGAYAEAEFSERGYQVVGLTNSDQAHPGWHQCDLRDRTSLFRLIQRTRPTAILHLAGIASPVHENQAEFYESNTVGTMNLLDALAAHSDQITKVVLASSSNVYGAQAGSLDENKPIQPKGHYATSKAAMELMARNYFESLPIVIARPFNYTGVGQTDKFVVPKIVNHFRDRVPTIQLGNVDVERDFMDVRDTVAAYLAILESRDSGFAVNICSGRAVSLNYVISTLSSLAGHQLTVEVNPDFVRSNDIPLVTGDPSNLTKRTGFKPRFQIEDTLNWMLST